MRNRMLKVLMVTAAVAGATTSLSAQTTFGVMGGASVPMGDFKDAGGKTGWVAGAGVEMAIKPTVGFKVDATYGSNKFETATLKTNIINVNGSVVLHFAGSAGAQPYVQAGVGYISSKTSISGVSGDSEGEMAISGGIGVNFGSMLFAEGRYMNGLHEGGGTHYLTFVGGIHFGGKK